VVAVTRSLVLTLLALLVTPLPLHAQKYPEKPVRMIVAFPTGAPQILSLILSDKLRESMGQPVVPDFRGGAGGNLASELAAKAPPDGHTVLLTSATIVISPSLFTKLAYDPFRDFVAVTQIATVPNVMVVHPSVPAKTIRDLVALAKAQPGKLNFGSGGLGSGSQLGSELFKAVNKVNMVHVPYKGAAIAMNAMLSGEVDMVVSTLPATIPYIKAGRLRALAMLAPERAPALPQVPTTAEAGMPEVVVITWYGLFAPAGTRPEIVERLNGEVAKVLHAADIKAKLAQVGLEVTTSTPSEFAKFVRAESEKWAKVIKAANIRADAP
jgi:tripartite-type tricarboxylate transporter receptor subunit TctC